MNNEQELQNWLEYQLSQSKEQCEGFSQSNENGTYDKTISMLEFRIQWLETQLSEFQQFPIGFRGTTRFPNFSNK